MYSVCTRSIGGITLEIAFARDDACACDVRGKQVLVRGKFRSFQSDFKCSFIYLYIYIHIYIYIHMFKFILYLYVYWIIFAHFVQLKG